MARDHIDIKMEVENNWPGVSPNFHSELASLLNRYGIDAVLDTPDHVLATMLIKNLDAYGEAKATTKRLAPGNYQQTANGGVEKIEDVVADIKRKYGPPTQTVNVGGCRGSIEVPVNERKC